MNGEDFTRLDGIGETTQATLYSQEFSDRKCWVKSRWECFKKTLTLF